MDFHIRMLGYCYLCLGQAGQRGFECLHDEAVRKRRSCCDYQERCPIMAPCYFANYFCGTVSNRPGSRGGLPVPNSPARFSLDDYD